MFNTLTPDQRGVYESLLESIRGLDLNSFQELLDSNQIDINTQDDSGWTLLHYAIRESSIEFAHVLLNKGAGVNIKTKGQMTAFNLACQFNVRTLIPILINAGADVNTTGASGATPLRYLTFYNLITR